MIVDREIRLVLEDAGGARTYFYRHPAAFWNRGRAFFLEAAGEREAFADRRVPGKAFFNSSLLGPAGIADISGDSAAHARASAAYAILLARAMGCRDKSALAVLERGAYFHDIGKSGLPPEIVNKAGALTAVEREIVMEHPVIGHRILGELGFFGEAASIVLCHHERFDGRGYPFGLAGDEIPEGARIFALADTLDAVTSDRPYRKGRSFPRAVREIVMEAGGQFDPRVVGAFLSVPLESWIGAGREAKAEIPPAPAN